MQEIPTVGRRVGAGIGAGLAAGFVMALGMMVYLALHGHSAWTNANFIAAMWYGEQAANGNLSSATMVGLVTHFMASAIMGALAVPFVFGLPRWRVLLNSLAFALASYPVAFATIMIWADPIMFRKAELVTMSAMHAIFGITFGLLYPRLAHETD